MTLAAMKAGDLEADYDRARARLNDWLVSPFGRPENMTPEEWDTRVALGLERV